MTSSKFKNAGNFATSAVLSALVIGLHVAGVQLLIADQASSQNEAALQAQVAVAQDPVKPMVQIEGFVVTASRL